MTINVKKASGQVRVALIAPQPKPVEVKPVEVKFIAPKDFRIIAWCPERDDYSLYSYAEVGGACYIDKAVPVTFKPRKHAKLRAAWSA